MDIIYHYPHELTQLLIQAIPLLSKSKKDVLLFFKGAGVSSSIYTDLEQRVNFDRQNINKYEISREIIQRLNESGETTLRERREILKRITEFEDFSTCWPDDQLKAKGLVSEIRRVINIKDSFTRMKQEVEKEKQDKKNEYLERVNKEKERKLKIENVKNELFGLFSIDNPHQRGKKLENVLNELFKIYDISIREAFTLSDDEANGIYEQIDGVIGLDGEVYLVEMKWKKDPIGKDDISSHLVRVYHRGYSRGIFISASNYTEPAIYISKEALQRTVFTLVGLDELIFMLETKNDLRTFLKTKIEAALVDKNPFLKIDR